MGTESTICVTSGIYPPETGGPAKFVETFMRWGQQHNIQVDCVSLSDGREKTFHESGSRITLISRDQPLIRRYLRTTISLIQMMLQNRIIVANGLFLEVLFAYLLTRKQYICKVPGDIVWERARNSKLTNLDINAFQNAKLNLRYSIFRYLFSKSLKCASKVIVPSSHLKSLCVNWGVKPERIVVIFNSVNTNKFIPLSEKSIFDVVVVNRLVAWKHVDEVIDVCHELDLSLLVVGDGPERNNLEAAAGKFGKVTFVGERSQEEIPRIINQARCYVLNSSFEATSYSLLEARSAGLFCIANAGTGSEEVIKHMIDGVLCGPNGVSLLNALTLFKENLSFVERASDLGRQDAHSRFNLEKNYLKIYQLVEELT